MNKNILTNLEIEDQLKEILNKKRYYHTIGVAHTSACMAMCHGIDMQKAYLAGLLHDNAKCITDDQKLSICSKYGLTVSNIQRTNPDLLHAKVGAYLAKSKFGISDEDILNAIENHTTGRPGMSDLEKIIFIADYIEPRRNPFENILQARALAFKDLNGTILCILKNTINYLEENNIDIDPMSHSAYEYYLDL